MIVADDQQANETLIAWRLRQAQPHDVILYQREDVVHMRSVSPEVMALIERAEVD